jgi:hypothetical protein
MIEDLTIPEVLAALTIIGFLLWGIWCIAFNMASYFFAIYIKRWSYVILRELEGSPVPLPLEDIALRIDAHDLTIYPCMLRLVRKCLVNVDGGKYTITRLGLDLLDE